MPLEACARRDGSLLLLVPLALAGLMVCTTAQICIIKDCDADCDQMWFEARLRVPFTLKMAARLLTLPPSDSSGAGGCSRLSMPEQHNHSMQGLPTRPMCVAARFWASARKS